MTLVYHSFDRGNVLIFLIDNSYRVDILQVEEELEPEKDIDVFSNHFGLGLPITNGKVSTFKILLNEMIFILK